MSDVAGARADGSGDVDEWVREVIDFHFSPRTGSPFWLDRARTLDFDPRRDVRSVADLHLFPVFDVEVLRTVPVRALWPAALADRHFDVFETGGTTGRPAVRLVADDARIDYEALADLLPTDSFPQGADWLTLGPTGPHRVGEGIRALARARGGIRFAIDLDPRFYRDLLRAGLFDTAERYEEHLIAQARAVVERHRTVRCLHVSSSLLAILMARAPEVLEPITGILCSGTAIRPDLCRLVADELPGTLLLPVYGNTLMGLSPHCPDCGDATRAIDYRPLSHRSVVEVVDAGRPELVVDHGATGRVCISTLTRECFLPRVLERDDGERIGACPHLPRGGVRNVRPARVPSVDQQLAGVY